MEVRTELTTDNRASTRVIYGKGVCRAIFQLTESQESALHKVMRDGTSSAPVCVPKKIVLIDFYSWCVLYDIFQSCLQGRVTSIQGRQLSEAVRHTIRNSFAGAVFLRSLQGIHYDELLTLAPAASWRALRIVVRRFESSTFAPAKSTT